MNEIEQQKRLSDFEEVWAQIMEDDWALQRTIAGGDR